MPVTLTFKTCIKCLKTLDLIHFHKRSDSKDGYRNDCKSCNQTRAANWVAENPEKTKETQDLYYINHKEDKCAYQKQYRIDNPLKVKMQDMAKYSHSDKESRNEYSRQYRKKNPKKVQALTGAYRNKKAAKISKPFFKDIKQIYENCPAGMVVDHIIPISNEFISGLHLPWNLQYLKPDMNKKKSNKFDGTYDNESWKLAICP